jgi:thiamine kinase-like enzyme
MRDLERLIDPRKEDSFIRGLEEPMVSFSNIRSRKKGSLIRDIGEPTIFSPSNFESNARREDYHSLQEIIMDMPDTSSRNKKIYSIYSAYNFESKIINKEKLSLDRIIENNSYILEDRGKEIISLYSPLSENFSNKKKEYRIIKPEISENISNIYDLSSFITDKSSEKISKNIYSIESIILPYIERGYSIKKSDYFFERDSEASTIGSPAAETKRIEQTTGEHGVPAEYHPLLQMLAKEHPGIKYKGRVSLENKSQHNVDILTFEYIENGKPMQIYVVAKDRDEVEERIPAFLNELGIRTHSVYDLHQRLLMQHVGQRELRELVKNGSESDVIKACGKALDKIAMMHVLASMHLTELKQEHGIVLPTTNYAHEFENRFLSPVSGNSLIISPQRARLMQAYSSFAEAFNPKYFVHGDFHTGNCRLSEDECFIFDYEWAKIGMKFDDLSRFANSVMRDRPDFDSADFSRDMLRQYVEKHNQHSEQQHSPLMLPNQFAANALRYALINDEMYKIGEYILFAQTHASVAEEKMEKSVACLERAVRMLDSSIQTTEEHGNYTDSHVLANLRRAFVDYVAESHVECLKRVAEKYKSTVTYSKKPLILVPAA